MKKAFVWGGGLLLVVFGLTLLVDPAIWMFLVYSSRFNWTFEHNDGRTTTGRDDFRDERVDAFIAGRPSGRMIYTDKKGNRLGEYRLENGAKTGEEMYWDKSGAPVSLATYSNGVPHGIQKQWHDGTLVFYGDYVNGERHGTFTNWYDDGAIHNIASYSNGVKHGEYRYYSPSGRMLAHCTVSNWFTVTGTDVVERTSWQGTTLAYFTNGVQVKKWQDWEKWE